MAIIPAPAVPEHDPYRTFTQDNFLNEQTDAILLREVLTKQGMTLDRRPSDHCALCRVGLGD